LAALARGVSDRYFERGEGPGDEFGGPVEVEISKTAISYSAVNQKAAKRKMAADYQVLSLRVNIAVLSRYFVSKIKISLKNIPAAVF